jgi:16S rRNA (guanine966-N2)-methyltransferase
LRAPSSDQRQFDIIFVDPPFASSYLEEFISLLSTRALFAKNCRLYVESAVSLDELGPVAHWQQLKAKKAGKVHFGLWQYNG